jgi:dTDP-glucose 4,6-dehydratase
LLISKPSAGIIKTWLAEKENLPFVQEDICDRKLVAKLLVEQNINTTTPLFAKSNIDRLIFVPSIFYLFTVIENTHGQFTCDH